MDRLWEGLADGGKVMMPLDKYDWSERYGWLADRWGLNWQIALGKHADVGRTVTPSLLFGGDAAGQAAGGDRPLHLGLPAPRSTGSMRYDGSGKDAAGTVMHAQFRIDGQALMAMDSAEADAAFTEALSLMVNCEDQAEIDRLWSALSAVPEAEACGWVKDRFGVSWQIVPRALWRMMASGDKPARRADVRRGLGHEEARPRRDRARLRRHRDRALVNTKRGAAHSAPRNGNSNPREKTMPDDLKIDARTMRGVIPYIGMNGKAGAAADFYVRAFAARDLGRLPGEDDPSRSSCTARSRSTAAR